MKAFLSFLMLFVSTNALALQVTETHAYYGEKFYQDLANKENSDTIKANIREVLKSVHVTRDGKFDEIKKSCDQGAHCYSQKSIGYDGARVFLLGVFYLEDLGSGNYGIHDMYCDNLKTAADFNNGKNAPAPNKIPNPNVINIEHTWPQSRFGGDDRSFQKSDLHHLFPTDSQANSTRGSYRFGEVRNDRQKVKCRASYFGDATDGTQNVFEPPQDHKGNVARALFYFSTRYGLKIDPSEEAYLRQWSKEDPIDQVEIQRNDEIFKLQNNRNPFIDVPGLEETIENF